MQVTQLQKEMLIRIAEEHDFAPERSNNFADYLGCPVVDAILNAQDKGTVTSLVNANLVKHWRDEVNFVGLTREGFEAYLSIRN